MLFVAGLKKFSFLPTQKARRRPHKKIEGSCKKNFQGYENSSQRSVQGKLGTVKCFKINLAY